MTGDRHDELAALDLSMIAVALTPSWLVCILTIMPVWLYFSSFLFCSLLFFNTKLYILHECELCLIFIIVRKLAIWTECENLKNSDCSFRFLFEDFRLYSRYNNVDYGAWHVHEPLFWPTRLFRNFAFNYRKKIGEKSRKRSDIEHFGRWPDSFSSALCTI